MATIQGSAFILKSFSLVVHSARHIHELTDMYIEQTADLLTTMGFSGKHGFNTHILISFAAALQLQKTIFLVNLKETYPIKD